jgi:hypothetical protein
LCAAAATPAHPCGLDLEVLRTALSRLLSLDDDGYLIYQLVVEGMEPAQVAAERGISRPVLVEQLRDAVGALATRYEPWPTAT